MRVVISRRDFAGNCSSAIGSYIVVNSKGWILTAAHVLRHIVKLVASHKDWQDWQKRKEEIIQDPNLNPTERKRRLKKVRTPPKDATQNFSPWWGRDNLQIVDAKGSEVIDLAAAKLEPFDPSWISEYPTFVNPENTLSPGTSLCRIGFPFHSIKPSFDESKNTFLFPPESLPLPVFPIEGILTRFINVPNTNKSYFIGYIETSSPGLMGQSGGPILDKDGIVWGIQSQTQHLSLGFNPPIPGENKERHEHQFLNVGWAVHPATVHGFLSEMGIEHELRQL